MAAVLDLEKWCMRAFLVFWYGVYLLTGMAILKHKKEKLIFGALLFLTFILFFGVILLTLFGEKYYKLGYASHNDLLR